MQEGTSVPESRLASAAWPLPETAALGQFFRPGSAGRRDWSPAAALAGGIARIPEDRHAVGTIGDRRWEDAKPIVDS